MELNTVLTLWVRISDAFFDDAIPALNVAIATSKIVYSTPVFEKILSNITYLQIVPFLICQGWNLCHFWRRYYKLENTYFTHESLLV